VSEKLRTIRLYGMLGAKFGRVHRLAVKSTAEAVRALCVVVPGFEKFMMNAKDGGLTFAVFNGRRNQSVDEIHHPAGGDEIRIAPIIAGAKGGFFQFILGAVLIAASFIPGVNAALWSGASAALLGMGASMALGGLMQMLSPQTSGLASTASNGASYYFNGPANSSAQGEPVPLVYGRMLTGSKVVSSGIYAEDQA
jgi:predicted phage tail protein